MINNYSFNYSFNEAKVELEVDTDVFTEEIAKDFLEFFDWEYEEDENPIDEYLKKLALRCISVAAMNDFNSIGVISHFTEGDEGFPRVDGTVGIKLIKLLPYEFDERMLEVEITENAEPKPLPRALLD